jgi:hypothetical protein
VFLAKLKEIFENILQEREEQNQQKNWNFVRDNFFCVRSGQF